ncbi:MAG TPA: amidase family protein, partial [Methanocorpusculum sp.]|nr:amidase family protein [Methanocorpusculum sp.]
MNDIYNAYLNTTEISGSGKGVLAGVRISIKDNISTKDIETTCASKILKGYLPPYDAHAITLLKSAGATIAGKTNMDE